MPSLALIDHLINVADGTASGPVPLRSAERAAAWCEYLESHARRIYGLVGDIGQLAAAELAKKLKARKVKDCSGKPCEIQDRSCEKIKECNNKDGFTIRDIYRNQWHLLTSKEAVKAACYELAEAGWLREQQREIPGRQPTKFYLINPKIFS